MKYTIKKPQSLDDAINMLDNGSCACLAGGTNLLVTANKGGKMPTTLIDITTLEELRGIEQEGSFLKIGSLVTFGQIEKSSFIKEHFPCLFQAAAEVGGPQIRNVATIGGNICDASPAADSSAALLALDAQVELKGPRGSRRMPVSEFFIHVGMTAKQENEILTYIYIPLSRSGSSTFYKVGKRNALAISVVNMAVYIRMQDDVIAEVTVAVGAVAPIVKRAEKTEQFLTGKTLSRETIKKAKQILLTEISPIDDIRATALYRKTLCCNILENLLTNGKGV